ncbi:proton-conducting transporter transmembrane domain-containing protein, partial [Klebsiella oxytoca]|uniref:proton-conducting transporter transmembrane domain-containing protein n=3 Tax=Pseudomonadota TaxID=1224 RepID=UPI002230DD13
AVLPVHGWLIQVMEAPTPVSALLHAGVVNLGGFVLIRFAPLLEQAGIARALLLVFGLGTAVLAGMVMLTRISIKVRLAWSTVAQMGFMLLECGLGLYTLAALHLVGHSLYKAHVFLSASTVVRQTRLQSLH